MSYFKGEKQTFLNFLNINKDEVPSILILISSSDFASSLSSLQRILHPNTVRPTAFSTVRLGSIQNLKIAFGCSYATSLTADIVHAFCCIGVRLVVNFGFCGILTSELERGDLIFPTEVIDEDGIASVYGRQHSFFIDHRMSEFATSLFDFIKPGVIVTWKNLFSENELIIQNWIKNGIHAVDLESSAIFSVCAQWAVPCCSFLLAADNLKNRELLHEVYSTSIMQLKAKRNRFIRRFVDFCLAKNGLWTS